MQANIVSYKHKPKSELAKVSMKSFQRTLYLIPDYRFFSFLMFKSFIL